jgi:ankyrin repeat protein
MNDKDVESVLLMLGLKQEQQDLQDGNDASAGSYSRDELIPRLMNITLQCLGTIRALVVEQEKIRIAKDCNDIDGTCRDDGAAPRLERELFRGAVNTLTDTIVTGQELNHLDPSKDLIESFPCAYQVGSPGWLMLNWTITKDGMPPTDDEDENFHTETIHRVLDYFPACVDEIDKKGQRYFTYVLRTNNTPLIEDMIKYDPRTVNVKDGTGQYPLHFTAAHAQTSDLLYTIIEAIGAPAAQLASRCFDDNGNLPLHSCVSGSSCLAVLKEILFAYPDAVKVPNKEGKLPLHLAACNNDVEKLSTVFSAFPHAISIPDKNGWIPIMHAAYTCKSLEVVQFLHDSFPDSLKRPHQSGRLPLHYAAVSCASSKVMKYIIDAHPAAASSFDVNRRLPLHNCIARCEHMTPSRLRCLRLLLEAYPLGVNMAGKDDRTPLDLARRDRHGDLVSEQCTFAY